MPAKKADMTGGPECAKDEAIGNGKEKLLHEQSEVNLSSKIGVGEPR
jgi:hypothetical protein